ncbi:MAG: alpha-L-fucosidase [Planctomycetota bacterium]|nr:alpha-L-fucosidase [Planctomycetota bacterium]
MLLRLRVVGMGVAALLAGTGCMAAGQGEPAAAPAAFAPAAAPAASKPAARADGTKTLLVPAGTVAPGPFKPDWESLKAYEVPEWFRDAKFGIWAHWTAQCVPEQGDWYARRMYEEGSNDYKFHVEHYGHPSKVGFKDICNMWKAEKWEPAKLIDLYRKAGAKYFVALANHHCNFDCWDSKYHEWNSVKVGPKKDLVGAWADAARRAGLRFGVTVHAARAWTWYEVAQGADKAGPLAGVPYDGKLTKADGKGLWWDGLDPQVLYAQNHKPGEKPDQAYVDQFYARVTDLVDHYKPDLLYFDDSLLPLNNLSDAGLRIAAHLYNSSIQWHGGKNEAVMNTKAVPAELRKALVWDIERGRSDRLEPFPWQTDTCIGSWHYNASLFENHRYKTATTVITTLIDIVSKNGNLLLNVPVKGDGTIDTDEVKVLEDMARWMEVNGVAIFGTRPWIIFGEGAADVSGGNFGEGRGRGYTAEDIRFTTKGDTIYAFILGWPQKPVVIRSMAAKSPLVEGEVGNVALLGHDGKLQWSRTDEGLVIEVPDQKPCEHAFAFRITGLKTNASADTRNLPYVPKPLPPAPAKAKATPAKAKVTPGKPVSQAADGSITLGAEAAETHGLRIKLEVRYDRPNLGYWDGADDWASWKVTVRQAGTFEVAATVSARSEPPFVVEVGSQQLAGKAPNTGDWAKYQAVPLGKVEIKEPGEIVVKVRPKDAASWKAINLADVTLKPAK